MNSYPQQPLVLVIDDDSEVLSQVDSVLTSAGYACHCSSTGSGAIRFARSTVPDLIICDMHLGGHSGLALCEELKADWALRDVPLMFLSSTQIPDIIRRRHNASGAYHLRKPFDRDVLMELVDKALWAPHLVRNGPHAKKTATAKL